MLALALLAGLQFHYDASEFVNAVYHVSCLTGRLPCSNPVYTKFWNEAMHVTREDGAQFDKWSAIFDRAQEAAPKPPRAALLPNYPTFYPGLRVREHLVSIALEARSPEQFRKRAAAVVGAEDAAALANVLTHTMTRLHSWYVANGPAAKTRLKLVETQVRANRTPFLIDGIVNFVRADFPARKVWVHAMPSPAPKKTDASATVVRNHFVVELIDKMEGTGAASIVLHELTHALYHWAREADHLKLIGQFAATKHAAAPALYGLLNETLATAIQLLLDEQQCIRAVDKDVYRHPYIPRVGRSTMPLVKRALAQRTTILDGFVPAYIEAAEKELKEEIRTPKFLLLAAGVLAGAKNKAAQDAFFESFRSVGSTTSEENLEKFDNLPAVRLITYEEQSPHLAAIPDLSDLTKHRGFAYRMPAQRPTYILAARDTEALIDIVKELAKLEKAPAEGLLFNLKD